ncbi:MAG: SH3 domain-containing protein [Phycisphaerae bacterium]|nr:SH3 domain-containing protein [Phycisphaerae bacterium]
MQGKHLALATVGMLLIGVWGLAAEEKQDKPPFEPYVGEITAKNLNVRSGPSTNYYVVTRLRAGDRVGVFGTEHGWLKIVPPSGCFSLIAEQYVDRGDGVNGVVNADNVYVRAGSELSSHNYAKQLKLKSGALIRIIGPADDDFLKIEPPEGAALWVSHQYIQRVAGAVFGAELADARQHDELADARHGDKPASSSGEPAVPLEEGLDVEVVQGEPMPGSSVAAADPQAQEQATEDDSVPVAEYRSRLEALDARLKEEMGKPLEQRDFSELLPGFRELSEQDVDGYTKSYAGVRVRQIEAARDMIEGVRKVRQLREEVRSTRKDALAERSNLRPLPVRIEAGFDIEGELHPSALYSSPVGPQRYRLIDPDFTPPRTLGYVEIPPDSGLDARDFLGRRVGVRARERILQTGDVDPISIYVAAELVVLDRPDKGTRDRIAVDSKEGSDSDEETASASHP